jgi:hypothetical protein
MNGTIAGRGLPLTLHPADQVRTVFAYRCVDGRDWRDCLSPEFWRADMVMRRLQPGDRIEVQSADCQVQFEIAVVDVNPHANPPKLDMAFRPIYPFDLRLPEPTISEPPRYRVRENLSRGYWEIVDRDGVLVADGLLDREAAQRALGALDATAPPPAEQPTAISLAMLAARPLLRPKPSQKRPRGRPRRSSDDTGPPPPLAASPPIEG